MQLRPHAPNPGGCGEAFLAPQGAFRERLLRLTREDFRVQSTIDRTGLRPGIAAADR